MNMFRYVFCLLAIGMGFLFFSIEAVAASCTVETDQSNITYGNMFICKQSGANSYVTLWLAGSCPEPLWMVGINQPGSGWCRIECARLVMKCS